MPSEDEDAEGLAKDEEEEAEVASTSGKYDPYAIHVV